MSDLVMENLSIDELFKLLELNNNPQVVEETASVQSVAPLESREFDPLGQMNQDQVSGLMPVLLR